MPGFCIKCKKVTESKDEKREVAKNGRPVLKSECAICGTKKAKFIKS